MRARMALNSIHRKGLSASTSPHGSFKKEDVVLTHQTILHDSSILEMGYQDQKEEDESDTLRMENSPLSAVSEPNCTVLELSTNFRSILLRDLKVGKVHKGTVLHGSLCCKSIAISSAILNVFEEDGTGDAVRLVISTNAMVPKTITRAKSQVLYPEGAQISIREPYLKCVEDQSGALGLFIEEARDILIRNVPPTTQEELELEQPSSGVSSKNREFADHKEQTNGYSLPPNFSKAQGEVEREEKQLCAFTELPEESARDSVRPDFMKVSDVQSMSTRVKRKIRVRSATSTTSTTSTTTTSARASIYSDVRQVAVSVQVSKVPTASCSEREDAPNLDNPGISVVSNHFFDDQVFRVRNESWVSSKHDCDDCSDGANGSEELLQLQSNDAKLGSGGNGCLGQSILASNHDKRNDQGSAYGVIVTSDLRENGINDEIAEGGEPGFPSGFEDLQHLSTGGQNEIIGQTIAQAAGCGLSLTNCDVDKFLCKQDDSSFGDGEEQVSTKFIKLIEESQESSEKDAPQGLKENGYSNRSALSESGQFGQDWGKENSEASDLHGNMSYTSNTFSDNFDANVAYGNLTDANIIVKSTKPLSDTDAYEKKVALGINEVGVCLDVDAHLISKTNDLQLRGDVGLESDFTSDEENCPGRLAHDLSLKSSQNDHLLRAGSHLGRASHPPGVVNEKDLNRGMAAEAYDGENHCSSVCYADLDISPVSLRMLGNKHFAQQDWVKAIDFYTKATLKAIQQASTTDEISKENISPNCACHYTKFERFDIGHNKHNSPKQNSKSEKVVATSEMALDYSNRAEAWLRLHQYERAWADAERALSLDPSHLKSLFRKGKALLGMGNYKEALIHFEAARACAPLDKDILAAIKINQIADNQSSFGIYDLKDYYLKGRFSGEVPTCADYVGPVQIRASKGGNGRGLFLTKNVRVGDLMLVSNPLVMLTVEKADEKRRRNIFLKGEANIEGKYSRLQPDVTQRLVGALQGKINVSKKNLERLHALCFEDGNSTFPPCVPSIDLFILSGQELPPSSGKEHAHQTSESRLYQIVSRCTMEKNMVWSTVENVEIQPDFKEQSGQKDSLDNYFYGLWMVPSFINHSCVPNVSLVVLGRALFVYASKDLNAGEELLCSYFNIFQPVAQRRELASTCWNFVCKCPRCCFEADLASSLKSLSTLHARLEPHPTIKFQFSVLAYKALSKDLVKELDFIGSSDQLLQLGVNKRNWLIASYVQLYLANGESSGIHGHKSSLQAALDAIESVCASSKNILGVGLLVRESVRKILNGRKTSEYKAINDQLLGICKSIYGKHRHMVLQSLLDGIPARPTRKG